MSVRVSWIAMLCFVSCTQKAPVVNVNTVANGSDISFSSAYDIEEGSALDLVVDTTTAGATITTSTLPKNAQLKDGIFSFTPDYTQAGLYSITFTITAGNSVTTKTVGIRVQNVIHVAAPPLTMATEGSPAPDLMFASDDPPGTIVNYSADVTGFPGASFDPVSGKLSFLPPWDWLDTHSSSLSIDVVAQGQEVDTGQERTSTARVLYQITEATSFQNELVPLFLLPLGATGTQNNPTASPPPEWQNANGHNCLFCHDGQPGAPDGLDFRPDQIYGQLVGTDISDSMAASDMCAMESTAVPGVKRVVPGDLTKSLWFWKISGSDGNGVAKVPCGVQMPESLYWYYWTVSDQDMWNLCPPVSGEDKCREALKCVDTDIDCKLNARYVRKARIWIMNGALEN